MTSNEPEQPVASRGRARGSIGTLLLVLAAIVAAGGVAFAAGRLTAPASAGRGAGVPGGFPGASFAPDASGRPGGLLGPGGAQMTLTGTVSAISGDTLTVTTADGRTIEVGVAGSTWHAQASASASDVTAGSEVLVQLTTAGGLGPDPGASPAPGTGTVSAADVTILEK